VITCFHYLQRSLFPVLCQALAPGGLLICEIATRRNLERHARPSARFLLDEGELVKLVAPLEIVQSEEGWFDDRALARVVARHV
jgi:tellurite methyltransferase